MNFIASNANTSDEVWVYFTNHGTGSSKGNDTNIVLLDELVPDYRVAKLFDKLPWQMRILMITNTCFGGAFANEVEHDENLVLFAASLANQPAHGASNATLANIVSPGETAPFLLNPKNYNPIYGYSIFTYLFFSALRGVDAFGSEIDTNLDNNSIVTPGEAFVYAARLMQTSPFFL